MKRQRLQVDLTLIGPILTQSSSAGAPGIDCPVARNADGKVMLPYSLVKGKIVDAFREMTIDQKKKESWLGVGSVNGGYDPERGRLSFTDFVCQTPERSDADHDGIIERIHINDESGAVIRGQLAMLEAPFGYGEPVHFLGYIDFVASDAEAKEITATMQQAFDIVNAYGALRTIGFGRMKQVNVKLTSVPAEIRAKGTPVSKPLLAVRYHMDRPFCVVGRKHAGNHFDSLEWLPGQVLKGAVARLLLEMNGDTAKIIDNKKTYQQYPTLCQYIDVIRFSEAKPMKIEKEEKQVRPIQPPLSVVTCPTIEKDLFDVALLDGPQLINKAAPAFASDWKDKDAAYVNQYFGWPSLDTERRVRTSIHEETWKAADSELFSYSLVRPKEHVWEGSIGLHQVPQAHHAKITNELSQLLANGLPNIGKTRAIAGVEWLAERTPPKVKSSVAQTSTYVITLQTDCLMTNPATLQHPELKLHDAYADFWKEVSVQSLSLVRFFARQTLHGGYVARRANRQTYKPFLLTDRGSTFVLNVVQGKEKEAHQFIRQLTDELFLPTPAWITSFYGPTWSDCPFLPHVGYGEVVVNLDTHTQRKPQ